ncbi:MAG: hypothetical protein ABIW17_06300 [Marmoricola sp.]
MLMSGLYDGIVTDYVRHYQSVSDYPARISSRGPDAQRRRCLDPGSHPRQKSQTEWMVSRTCWAHHAWPSAGRVWIGS